MFLTPNAEDVQRTLHVAEVADQHGLDLVGIQDHPYQESHLDAWSLIATALARTGHVRVFPDGGQPAAGAHPWCWPSRGQPGPALRRPLRARPGRRRVLAGDHRHGRSRAAHQVKPPPALNELVLERGMDTFIFGTEGDDPDQIRVFADEVASAVRAVVADERS